MGDDYSTSTCCDKNREELLAELSSKQYRIAELEALLKKQESITDSLVDAEHKYRSLFNSVNDCIFIYDALTEKLLDVNESVRTMYGYTRGEAIADNLQALSPGERPYDSESALSFKTSAANGLPQTFQWVIAKANGKTFYAEIHMKRIIIADRDCLVVIVRDISRQRGLEDMWRRYEFIVNTSREFMTLINRDYVYEAINNAYSIAHGKAREDVIGRHVAKVWGQEAFLNIIKKHLDKCLAGSVVNYQSWFDFHALGLRFLDVTYYPYHRADGEVTHAVVVTYDITEKKKAEDLLRQSSINLERTLEGTIKAITYMVELRDPYTAGHQKRVAELASNIAKGMGFDENYIEGVKVTGYLHDIGKIVVPAEILAKPSRLNNFEMNIIRGHARCGYEILEGIDFPWPVAAAVLQHHERLNGTGYPDNLKDEQICMEARIIAVADVVESMASHRPYRAALGINKALEEIASRKNIHFDPKVVDTCLKLFLSKSFMF